MRTKKRLSDVKTELPTVVHKTYNYDEYSSQDESNDRFMRKQENTNTLKDDNIFTQVNVEETNKKQKKKDMSGDLFESTE